MPKLIQSDIAKGKAAQPFPSEAGAVIAKRISISLSANPAVGDIFEMLAIPPSCRPIDIVVDSDKLDSNAAPTIAFDVGVMSGPFGVADSARTVGQEFFAASPVGQAGGTARPTKKEAHRVANADVERAIGLKCTTAAATFAAGSIGITLFYVAD